MTDMPDMIWAWIDTEDGTVWADDEWRRDASPKSEVKYAEKYFRSTPVREHAGIYKRLLMEFTDWDGTLEVKPNANIKHGPCCVCSDCGHWHDECVCDHNYIVNQILTTIEAEEECHR